MIDLGGLTADFQQWKLWMLSVTGLGKDALHVHVGLAIFFATRLVWGGRWGWLAGWCAALGFAITGELFDWQSEVARGFPVPLAEHWHDIWNTMLWPSLLAVAAWRLTRPPGSGEDADQPLEQA